MVNSIDKKELELKSKCHLHAYDLMKSTAGWLDNPDNEIFGLLEYDDDSLAIAAKACVIASAILKKAALDIQLVSGIDDTNKYSKDILDAMSDLKSLADNFDSSGDENLMKTAGVLDEILLTITSNVQQQEAFKKNFEKKIDDIKKRSKEAKSKLTSEATEDKEKSEKKEKDKSLRPLEAPLSSRYCPDHHGESLCRLSENVYYCPMTKKQYDFENGYVTDKGNKVPGTTVSNQTMDSNDISIKVMFGDQ